jgi:hypothetical protein
MPFGSGTKQGLRLTTLGVLAILGGFYYFSEKQKSRNQETENRQDFAKITSELFKTARKFYNHMRSFNPNV